MGSGFVAFAAQIPGAGSQHFGIDHGFDSIFFLHDTARQFLFSVHDDYISIQRLNDLHGLAREAALPGRGCIATDIWSKTPLPD